MMLFDELARSNVRVARTVLRAESEDRLATAEALGFAVSAAVWERVKYWCRGGISTLLKGIVDMEDFGKCEKQTTSKS